MLWPALPWWRRGFRGHLSKLLAVFPANATKAPDKPKRALRIDDELIAYTIVRPNGGRVTLEDATRGFSGTTAVAHPAGTTAVRLCFYDGYDSFLPGTEDMNAEIPCRIAEVVRTAKLGHVALDGVEETYSAGHDVFSMNSFLRVLYDHLLTDGITYLSSYMAQYGWHVYSSQSWGENDMERGFRGSQLELRLNNQIRLKRNHVPNKMGQYYPSSASLEDIEWLMGLVAGYDAGVDFVTGLPNNPDFYMTVRHWEQARQNGAFTEKQKMRLRQTDSLFTLVDGPGGGWEPRFVRRWRSEQLESVPSSSAPVKALTALTGQVAPCGIDFGWTHSPGVCERSCITDDLVHTGGTNASKFEVEAPWSIRGGDIDRLSKGLPCVVRVPADSCVAVRNPSLVIYWGANLERQCRLCFPVTLEPGQYLSMPHHIPVAYVYDAGHQLLKEIPLRDLPDFACTRSQRLPVDISCEPVDSAGKAVLCVNLRFEESTLKK